jgi:hypothetical protein
VPADEPLPRRVPAPVIYPPPYAPPVYYRRSAYEVWQYYGVDRQGQFRPRVIYSPSGAYYLYNGAPFPWTSTRQLEFMPYAVD